ncbi:DNA-binding protein [Leifsonia sp. PS1209]|uniref:DNA-binding protein n=1 Tax=Leifsonia sp. PS1209 TaxID=2724914 RepID=UPI001442AC78|nr:DNA-binding protein [Leifsonia sp. PS1209]QIZ98072.1 DNA-binding protein [Leifsonia sp. PS1209]
MYVITADQVDSRNRPDIVASALDDLNGRYADRLELPVDRNAGDELQALTASADAAVDLVLDLTRRGAWSVGLGIGAVRTPLPDATRKAAGDAFVAARDAVTRAKRASTRFAAASVASGTSGASEQDAADVEALMNLLLTIRAERSDAGWELYDLLETGLTQAEAGARLGITPQSANDRARVANLRVEQSAVPALTRLVARADDAGHDAGRRTERA